MGGSNPGGSEIFRIRKDRLWGTHSPLYNGYRVSFPGVKRPVLKNQPQLALSLKKNHTYTSTPSLGFRDLFQGELF
jgi:hypothetical protein